MGWLGLGKGEAQKKVVNGRKPKHVKKPVKKTVHHKKVKEKPKIAKKSVKHIIKPKAVKKAKPPAKKKPALAAKKAVEPKKVVKEKEAKLTGTVMINEAEIKYDSKKLPVTTAIESEQKRKFRPKIDLKKCQKTYNCFLFCPTGAIKISSIGIPEINYDLCNGCLICLRECPTGAITEEKEK